jgi:molybdopterin molybdotransferase
VKTKEEALRIVLAAGEADRVVERVPLDLAHGRAPARDVLSDVDVPPFDKSSMDGYAIRSADAAAPNARFDVLGAVHAGSTADRPVVAGTTWKIMTGAPLPLGADAVVPVEEAERSADGATVVLKTAARPFRNVCRRGEDARAGDVVVKKGTPLSAAAIGMLATVGADPIDVYAAPSVCVVPTGDELVPPNGPPPGPGRIRECNGFLLEAAVRETSQALAPFRPGIARDDKASLSRFLDVGLDHDVLILSGGVSAGDLDLVGVVLRERGLVPTIEKVAIKPGKPLLFGHAPRPRGGRCAVFGLPGNPVSSLATFELFVRPYLLARLGRGDAAPDEVDAILEHDRPLRSLPRTQHVPALLYAKGGGIFATPLPWNGSADLRALVAADGFIVVPQNAPEIPPGAVVRAHRFVGRGLLGGGAVDAR